MAEVWQIARAIRDTSRCGWRVVGCDVNWEDADMYCTHTNERIESAYAEPDEDARPSHDLISQAHFLTMHEPCQPHVGSARFRAHIRM